MPDPPQPSAAERNVACPDCRRTFGDDNALYQHRRWSHGVRRLGDATLVEIAAAFVAEALKHD